MRVFSFPGALGVVLLSVTASSLQAQGQATTRNACAELAAIPSSLVNAPEGLALLRLKRELESAAFTMERQQQLQGADVQRITQVQRGVDSLIRIIVRDRGSDGADGPLLTIHRSDSLRMVIDGRGMEPRVEATIRSLQPKITAFIAAAEAQSGRDASDVGYIGIGLLGAQVRLVTPEGVLVSHCDYPIVETVDPGSPASRAGVASGDTLLAYNGRDLKQQAVNYQRMLVPGETVRMRVKRGRSAREIPVTVSVRQVAAPVERQMVFTRIPDGAAGGSVTMLFGAQLSTVDNDFAESLGMEPGVLVLRLTPGTPFAEAGLRAGEIIRTVNGTAVRDVQTLRRLIGGNAGREARMSVLSRTNGQRTVMVRW